MRAKISGTATRPRISVFRSNRGLSAQVIDDVSARTLAAVAWFEPELRSLGKAQAATRAGQLLAERAKAAGVSEAVFDRGGYRYHGHVRDVRRIHPRVRPDRLTLAPHPATLSVSHL